MSFCAKRLGFCSVSILAAACFGAAGLVRRPRLGNVVEVELGSSKFIVLGRKL
jgi:hypothetical protein